MRAALWRDKFDEERKRATDAQPKVRVAAGQNGWRWRNEKYGGEAGIRTLGRALRPYNGLANRRLQPLGHLTLGGSSEYPYQRSAGLRPTQPAGRMTGASF